MEELEQLFSVAVQYLPVGFLLGAVVWIIGWTTSFIISLFKKA